MASNFDPYAYLALFENASTTTCQGPHTSCMCIERRLYAAEKAVCDLWADIEKLSKWYLTELADYGRTVQRLHIDINAANECVRANLAEIERLTKRCEEAKALAEEVEGDCRCHCDEAWTSRKLHEHECRHYLSTTAKEWLEGKP